jgi:hypothetical protein
MGSMLKDDERAGTAGSAGRDDPSSMTRCCVAGDPP